jgi:predicted ferric reductase
MFGVADLLGPLAIAAVVATVCIWARNQGIASLYEAPGRAVGSWGLLTGLLSSVLMVMQVLLMARIPWVERAWGHDTLAHRHRWVGFASFWLLMVHVVAFVIVRLARDGVDPLTQLWALFVTESWRLFATVGTIMIIAVVVTSIRVARRRLRYESWHLLHLYAYLGMAFGFPHQLADGSDFHDPWAVAFWWFLYLLALSAILVFRIGLPLWRSVRHRIEVAGVNVEAPGVVSIIMRGRRLERLRMKSGQFFIWRFRDGPGWSRGNPYTISAAPRHDLLRITVQAVGDASGRASALRAGTRVLIEGPYGALTADRRRCPRMLLIAAGVGIAPIRALVEDSPYAPGETALVYRFTREDQAVFVEELRDIAGRRGVELHLMVGSRRAPDSWLPAGFAPGDEERWLRHHFPDLAERDVFVCGPPKWNTAVKKALHSAGARRRNVRSEEFSW